MVNNEVTGEYSCSIAWGNAGTSTTNRIFLTDQPEFISYAAIFD